MGLTLTKVSEDASSITLGWIAVPGCAGYRFSAEKQAKPSHTWDPSRNRIRFAKGSAWYRVEVLGVEDFGVYPPTGRQYPASYRSGPLGDRVPLPDKPGAFLGVYGPSKPDGTSTWAEVKANISAREQAMGRRYDFIMAVDDSGEWPEQRMAWIDNHGAIACNAGLNFGEVSSVASGAQDAKIDAFADHYAAMPFTVMVRLMHEFNQAHVSYTSLGKEQAWISGLEENRVPFPAQRRFLVLPARGRRPHPTHFSGGVLQRAHPRLHRLDGLGPVQPLLRERELVLLDPEKLRLGEPGQALQLRAGRRIPLRDVVSAQAVRDRGDGDGV